MPFNVLARHHQKTSRPQAPDPQELSNIRTKGQQSAPSKAASGKGSTTKEKCKQQDHLDSIDDPSVLKFYPLMWCQVLEGAKEKFQVFLTIDNGFPLCEVGLQEAKDCLLEAMEDFWKLDKKVELGV
jgi:hypothetical protein